MNTYKKSTPKRWMIVLSGLCFSFAFICKQSGLAFVLFGVLIIFFNEYKKGKPIKNILIFAISFLIPFLFLILILFLFGNFGKFMFWNVTYLSHYGSQIPLSQAFEKLLSGFADISNDYSSAGYIELWIIALLGFVWLIVGKIDNTKKIIVISFWVISFLTVVPGLYFRQHYFICLIPASVLLIGFFFDFLDNFLLKKFGKPILSLLVPLIFILILGNDIYANKSYLFEDNPETISKTVYGTNPFQESESVANYIKSRTSKNDKIAVIGSEPQIYFYADRYAATGYLYVYSLMEKNPFALGMQKEMIKEIETNKPKYIVLVSIPFSWLATPESETLIVQWWNSYVVNYKLTAFCDVYQYKTSSLKPAS